MIAASVCTGSRAATSPKQQPAKRPTLTLSEYRRATLLTRDCTGFDSFAALLTARSSTPAGYWPVLYTSPRLPQSHRPHTAEQLEAERQQLRRNKELADLYDRAQAARGDARRAVRL